MISEKMISRFYDNGTVRGYVRVSYALPLMSCQTRAICPGTSGFCSLEFVTPLYASHIPQKLSPTRPDGTLYGRFLEALKRGDKAGLFESMANLEEPLGKVLQILTGRSASNDRLLSALRLFAENHGLHLPTAWIREYRRSRQHKQHATV